jgi:pimeloyl-ACP methyl ester carboxylesterase
VRLITVPSTIAPTQERIEVTDVSNSKTMLVPGATLRYDVVGAGPVLLLIHGGIADSAMLKGLAGILANRYTIVTYDRRGYGDSPLEDPGQEQSVELHADDAHRLLSTIATEPANLLGLSSGAFIGLELAGRHPEQVRTAVAFEPPIAELLTDREQLRGESQEVYETYRRDGAQAAMARFTAMVQGDSDSAPAVPPGDPTPEMLELMARLGRNAEFFFAHEFLQFASWLPNIDALRSIRTAIGGGEASGTQAARRAANALAERLGTDVIEFPGDHGGLMTQPEAFAARLHSVLRG